MRVVALVPRYHDAVVGGSEEYLRRLFRGLHAAGVEVAVFTTRDTRFRPDGPYQLRWDNALAVDDHGADPFPVRRFPTSNVAPARARRWTTAIHRARGRAGAIPLRAGDSYIEGGMFGLESWAGTFAFRWTGGAADLELRGQGVDAVEAEVLSIPGTTVAIHVDGDLVARAEVPAERWVTIGARFTPRERARVRVAVARTYEPPGDARMLGVAVRRLAVRTEGGEREIPLDRDRERLLASMPTDELAEHLDREAVAAGARAALLEAVLKGPVSPSLVRAARAAARGADLVLATNAPFASMAQGLLVGRLARRPVVLLPFLHLRDPSHHRWALRAVLARADRVLCLSHSSCRLTERLWGTRARYLGGGIDPEEFAPAGIDAPGFRAAHGLGAGPLVVTVARKTPSKGYHTTCEAVRALRDRGVACEHVIVGPDEDGLPVDPAGGRVLGVLPRPAVLSALAAADVFTLPSVHESFGLAYLEAWMLGAPVVAHRLCDPAAELIDEGRDGLLVSDGREMVEALGALLADPARRRAFGEHGRRKTLAHFTWPHVVSRALDVLAEVRAPETAQ